jgi:hypothetical protein
MELTSDMRHSKVHCEVEVADGYMHWSQYSEEERYRAPC